MATRDNHTRDSRTHESRTHESRKKTCTNCGKLGHHFRMCTAPITSYGIIAFRMNQPDLDILDPVNIPKEAIEVLLIQRKDSIGFIEIIRAKYKLQDTDYIRQQIEGTTAHERNLLCSKSFEELWKEIWGNDAENKHYRSDYIQAKQKFDQLVEGFYIESTFITLKHLIETTPLLWTTPEWGFPKGRRNMYESDQECAVREFCEETNLEKRDFQILRTLEPIKETFLGNNQIRYEHIYYIAYVSKDTHIVLRKNESMAQEVGNIGWFSIENALKQIRITNTEKREILLRTSNILTTLCPIFTPSRRG